MSVLNLSGDEAPECPLCMEFLELDDYNFYPCSCGYQICRFCWNKIRTEGNGLCPACRTPYTENPADFKPLTSEEMAKIKADKRQKDQAKKQKITENRKHLANVRVVQKNLVFVVGLSPRLADPEILKKPDYFGKFGKIHKVVINHSTQYAGSQLQGPSASAYVTYLRSEDALRAIQAVNNIYIDGRTLKASLGTTKYCSHFMKNQSCPKNDCMYLHELGDEQASFTKEQMQQGKHTEYEKALHDAMSQQPASPSPELGGGSADSEWSQPSHWGSTPPRVPSGPAPDHWGGDTGSGHEWDKGNGESQGAWPDLGNYNSKGRFSSKEEADKAKSKSSSASESESPPPDGDQVVPSHVPSHGHHLHSEVRGLADAAWDDSEPRQPSPPPPVIAETSSQSSVPEPEPEVRPEQGWLENDLKGSISLGFLDDNDDLGFDPFHETQKGLADLLESEAAAQAQQQAKVASPVPDWRGQSSNPLGAGPSRVKLPPPGLAAPPGFQNSSAAQHLPPNNLGGFNQSGYGGPLGLPPVSSSAVDSLFGLGRPRSGPAPGFGGHQAMSGAGGQSSDLLFGLGAKSGGLDLGGANRLGLGGLGGYGDRMFAGDQKQNHLGPHLDNGYASKDWQDGLRALLPSNVNVSFGVNNSANSVGNNTGHFGLQNMHQPNFSQQQQQQQQQQERATLQHNTNWGSGLSNGLGNDWTMLDPAIVSGQLANSLEASQENRFLTSGNNLGGHPVRPESPPNWITANLEQLTAESVPGLNNFTSQNNLIPAFNGLGLGNDRGHGGRPGAGRMGGGQWGAVPPPASTATPPPGFSHHRQMGGPLGGHYQGFPGVNKPNEAHKIGEF